MVRVLRPRNSQEFLRDGDQLATRLTGTVKISGFTVEFETFLIGKVDPASGKMLSVVERSSSSPK